MEQVQEVYMLWFTYRDDTLASGEEVLLVGIYSSEEKALQAKERAAVWNGFKEQPDSFEINQHIIDQDIWTKGFTVC